MGVTTGNGDGVVSEQAKIDAAIRGKEFRDNNVWDEDIEKATTYDKAFDWHPELVDIVGSKGFIPSDVIVKSYIKDELEWAKIMIHKKGDVVNSENYNLVGETKDNSYKIFWGEPNGN
ncbi:hypothetical protein HN924_03035 [Candidatus Woesearchaeota archaeon]|jgi:hypothetical protein|nr:hypothetical protein [Candidatus Woesearchaeota archaeon]MBT7062917.1 hypothetical protein [Candidatus Woesearchaeota archaeon]